MDSGFVEIQVTKLICELTIVPPQPWPVIHERRKFQPISATISLVKKVGYPWTGDSITFQGFSLNDEEDPRPGIVVYTDCFPVFTRDSFLWAITYAENRWEEVHIDGGGSRSQTAPG